jgi:hypothetical protein
MGKRFDSYKRAIEQSGMAEVLTEGNRFRRGDANETAVFARELEEIDKRLFEKKYPEYKGTILVPVATGISHGADEYTYRWMEELGQAELLTNYGDDVPMVDAGGDEETSKLVSFAAGYQYTVQDLRRSQMTGRPIDARRGEACRRVLAKKVNDVIFFGESRKGITGFANNANVEVLAPTTGNWATATATQIIDDVRKMENDIFSDSKGAEMPDTLVLAASTFPNLSKPLGDNVDKTVLKFLKEPGNLMFIKNIEFAHELNTADAESDGPRAICYSRDGEKLEALVPIPFTQHPVIAKSLSFVVPCEVRVGGVVVRYPGSMRYVDGL